MAYYIFNVSCDGPAAATGLLRTGAWPVGAQERHSDALAPGDVALVYLANARVFIGRAELGSAVQDWPLTEVPGKSGTSARGVSLAQVEDWEPPVPMSAVLAQIDQSAGARGDFEEGVVRITSEEYAIALAVAAGLSSATG